MISTGKQAAHCKVYEMLFKIPPKEMSSEPPVCHALVSGELCLGELSKSTGCVKQSIPECCPFPAQDISDRGQGLSLLVLCSLLGCPCVGAALPCPYLTFTATVATLEPAITHISSIDCKVYDGMDYTRPDKYGIEGGKVG